MTSFIHTRPDRFSLLGLCFAPRADDLRVTLDTSQDAEVLDAVARRLGDRAPAWREVVAVLRDDPHLANRNATVAQKPLEAG